MTVDLSGVKIYIRPGYTDMRKGVNGLTVIIREETELNPLSGSVFLFCSRSRKLLKAVWRDKWKLRFLGILAESKASHAQACS
jgi:transposase